MKFKSKTNKKIIKKDNFYIISIEIVFFYLSWNFMFQPLFVSQITLCPKLYRLLSSIVQTIQLGTLRH